MLSDALNIYIWTNFPSKAWISFAPCYSLIHAYIYSLKNVTVYKAPDTACTVYQTEVDLPWSLSLRAPPVHLPKLWTFYCDFGFLFLKEDRQNCISFKLHKNEIHPWWQGYKSEPGKLSLSPYRVSSVVQDRQPFVHWFLQQTFTKQCYESGFGDSAVKSTLFLPLRGRSRLSWAEVGCVQETERSLDDWNRACLWKTTLQTSLFLAWVLIYCEKQRGNERSVERDLEAGQERGRRWDD